MLKKLLLKNAFHLFTSITLLTPLSPLSANPILKPLLARVVKICEGPQGPVGPQGPQGPIGPRGGLGPQGAQGPFGPQGPAGPVGPIGPTGTAGDPGDNGDVGPEGQQGPEGEIGPQGLTGPTGCPGPKGPFGFTGPTGNFGPTGPQGEAGTIGEVAGFAVARSEVVNVSHPPGDIIPVDSLAISSPGFVLIQTGTLNGSVIVPLTGTYLIYFQVHSLEPGSIALEQNGITTIPSSVYSTGLNNQLIAGSVIVNLNAGDIIAIINNSPANTITPTSSPQEQNEYAPAPVEIVFVILASPSP